jgi:hypothetical protein
MSIKKHPLDDPTQQQIIKELEARVEQERAKLIAALQQPRPTLNYHGLTLNLGRDEIQTIRDQGGSP